MTPQEQYNRQKEFLKFMLDSGEKSGIISADTKKELFFTCNLILTNVINYKKVKTIKLTEAMDLLSISAAGDVIKIWEENKKKIMKFGTSRTSGVRLFMSDLLDIQEIFQGNYQRYKELQNQKKAENV